MYNKQILDTCMSYRYRICMPCRHETKLEIITRLRGLIAERRIPRRAIAAQLGYSESLFSLILNGYRPMPEGFEERVVAELDLQEEAEAAAQEARERVLAGNRSQGESE